MSRHSIQTTHLFIYLRAPIRNSLLREALLIEPDALSALSNLQRLYMGQGRYEEARRLDSQLEKYRARNPYYHAWLGPLTN